MLRRKWMRRKPDSVLLRLIELVVELLMVMAGDVWTKITLLTRLIVVRMKLLLLLQPMMEMEMMRLVVCGSWLVLRFDGAAR